MYNEARHPMLNSSESPLHCAVLAGDYKSVKALSKTPSLLNSTNFLGFTALEIAQYLRKQTCERILSPNKAKRILVMKPGMNSHELLNHAQFNKYFHVRYCAHLFFPNYLFFQQILKELPWIMRKRSLKEENRRHRLLYQKELSEGMIADVAIQWIDENLGYGLFALQDMPVNTYIGEYTGLVRRLSHQNGDENEYCLKYPSLISSVVDSLAYGNETRFINHSDTPNLQPICICEHNLMHSVFITKVPIQAGTQLTFEYGKNFWKYRQSIQIP